MNVLTCSMCGSTVDADAEDVPAMAWSSAYERGSELRYCPTCTRDHLRAIEAKLEPEFW